MSLIYKSVTSAKCLHVSVGCQTLFLCTGDSATNFLHKDGSSLHYMARWGQFQTTINQRTSREHISCVSTFGPYRIDLILHTFTLRPVVAAEKRNVQVASNFFQQICHHRERVYQLIPGLKPASEVITLVTTGRCLCPPAALCTLRRN
jgi:hypothetical protein